MSCCRLSVESAQDKIQIYSQMPKNSDDNLAARMLIVAYAAGIVLIGAHPFEKQHGGLFSYLKKESAAIFSSEWLPARLLDGELSWQVGESNSLEEGRAGRRGQGFSVSGSQPSPDKNSRELDRLSKSDRSQLDSLLEAVAKQ